MPSTYKQKVPKPITKQGDARQRILELSMPYPKCTNCGRKASIRDSSHSKCKCGGTFQMYGVK